MGEHWNGEGVGEYWNEKEWESTGIEKARENTLI